MRAVYPGTFDPITNGHLDIITRALKYFDEVIVAVAASENKNPKFDVDFRVQMSKEATKEMKGVSVVPFDNLLVDFVKQNNSTTIIRGLRAVSDFEYELQIGYANASLCKEIETLYLMPSLKHAFVSSSIVRSILAHGGDIAHLVPPQTLPFLENRGKRCM